MEQIDSGQVHMWLAHLDEIRDARHLAGYQLLLSEEEQRKQLRFHFKRDRHRYLVTRAMQRTVLSKYVDIAPDCWRFAMNEYGKPSIAVEHAAARGIEFNLSHTDGLVVIAVTRGRAIGVDVENVRTCEVDIKVAERFFAADEVAELHTRPSEQQKLRFFEYWTLKESYIKARGLGLSISPQRFTFHLQDPDQIQLTIDPGLRDCAGRWWFSQLRVDDAYLTALCAERGAAVQLPLTSIRSWPA